MQIKKHSQQNIATLQLLNSLTAGITHTNIRQCLPAVVIIDEWTAFGWVTLDYLVWKGDVNKENASNVSNKRRYEFYLVAD